MWLGFYHQKYNTFFEKNDSTKKKEFYSALLTRIDKERNCIITIHFLMLIARLDENNFYNMHI